MKPLETILLSVKTVLLGYSLFMISTLAIAQKGEMTSNEVALNSSVGVFNWSTTNTIDMGKLEQNKPQTVEFEFTNTGAVPIVISKVEPSCGCTGVTYSKDPIGPNKKGFVKTTYNAANLGVFVKTITVFANIPELRTVLTIKGEVVKI